MMLRPPADANGSVPVSLDFGDDVVPLLLVDDQPSNLQALESLLGSTGCRLVRAQSADEALLALLNQDFAAIVLDIQMPGMNGLELATLIKQRRRSRHVPILFLTAHMIDERDMLQGYGTGAVDYLTKPIHPEILRSKIAVFVELFRKTRALARTNEMLQREMAERERMDEALRQANQELEWRVQERTEALQEADRRKDEFLASLAHELRNPLAPIRSAVEVLRRPELGPVHRGEAQAVIVRQVEHMTRLIDDLLDVSRITANKLDLRLEPVSVTEVLHQSVETSRADLDRARHTLTLHLPAEPAYVFGDPTRLTQIVSNLVQNACKYTPRGGHVTLSAVASNGHVEIAVRDNGIGIAAADVPRLFEKFSQVIPGLQRGGGGLGLGLALVRGLVSLHGGVVEVHSAGLGQGSEFVVRLPREAHVPEAAEPSQPALAAGPSRRVLVVDDNVDNADSLALYLRQRGHLVDTAYDGDVACRVAERFRPDVVLLDIGLPKLGGHEVCQYLRRQPWGVGMQIIAQTGWGQDADRLRSRDAGFDDHLVKPVAPAELLALIARAHA